MKLGYGFFFHFFFVCIWDGLQRVLVVFGDKWQTGNRTGQTGRRVNGEDWEVGFPGDLMRRCKCFCSAFGNDVRSPSLLFDGEVVVVAICPQ